jgi:hypothetical protein
MTTDAYNSFVLEIKKLFPFKDEKLYMTQATVES